MFRSLRFIVALLAVLGATLALADPPARVGRLALVENGVNFRVDRNDAGGPASINWPVSSGAEVDTERRGRAEIWVGSTAFRLAGSSELRFPLVDDRQINAQLLSGTLAVSILESDQSDDVTVLTPQGRVRFARSGRYRIEVEGDQTVLTTQAGAASFDDGERRMPVEVGQRAAFYGGGRMRIENAEAQDAFDQWVATRESAALANAGPRHVSPAMTGYQDLDAYGDWQSQPDYGAVWYPRAVADDWAPYRFGRWVWLAPWGWTWVDSAPWGFAPFHYGRWVQVRGRWGWAPGSYVARPVYAPALVAWIGNPGWNVSFGFGSALAVGWFPLAPREVYVPGFRASPAYVRQINVTHIQDRRIVDQALRDGPPRHYAYRDMPRAVTVVPAQHLREGRPITAGELGRHDQRELARAPQPMAMPDRRLLPPENLRRGREAPAVRSGAPEAPVIRSEPQIRPPNARQPSAPEARPQDAMPVPPRAIDGPRAPRVWQDAPRGETRPIVREPQSMRPPESGRGEIERRAPPAVRILPEQRAAPGPDAGWRDQRPAPPGRDLSRENRGMPRQEMPAPRPREMPPPMPQAAPQPMRAPPPPAAAPAPRGEARAPEQGRGNNPERRQDRDHGNERGPR